MDESREGRVRALAALYGFGALLCLPPIIYGPAVFPQTSQAGGVVTFVAAVLACLLLMAAGDRLSERSLHLALAAGSLAVSAGLVVAGGGASSATYLSSYVWVGLYCGAYLSRRATAVHLGVAGVGLIAALTYLGEARSALIQLPVTLGVVVAIVFVVRSLTQRIQLLAGTDSLTGLANRRTLYQRLEGELARGRVHPVVAVVAVDMDGFKELNDREGHQAGDRLLCEASVAWSGVLRGGDMLARHGGDEFTAVLVGADLATAEQIARRLVALTPAPVTASAGVAVFDGTESVDGLLNRADAALYRAKRAGGGDVAVTDAADTRPTASRRPPSPA
jgi:diguanylate cyclase (GGDEF)-like protein